MPYPHQVSAGIFTSPHQIANRLNLALGNGYRGDLTQPQQPGQMRRISGIFSELENDLDFRGLQGCFLVRVKGFGGWVESGRWWCDWRCR
jgi:hypothetical protein